MKVFLCFFIGVVFSFLRSGAQNTQESINSAALTSILPPPPNAFELTKYSGVAVSKSSGSFQTSIPFSNVKIGNIVVPIGLSYNSGNGVKVNQIASRVGLGWNLETGGVITRTVMGLQDEEYTMLIPPDNFEINKDGASYTYLDVASNGIVDTQSDLFSFSFLGYSGKFYLKPNHPEEVVQLSPSPLKIETNFNGINIGDWTLKVIDGEGNEYFFGGDQATEKSKTNNYLCGKNYTQFVSTAWYLKRIKGAKGEEVHFTYDAITYSYFQDISQTLIRTPQNTLSTGFGSDNCPPRTENQICVNDLVVQGRLLRYIDTKFLNVTFHYASRSDLPGEYLLHQAKFIKKGILVSDQNIEYDKYDLTYSYGVSSNSYYNYLGGGFGLYERAFLSQVARSVAGVESQTYKMSYHNINGLPSRLSFSQDYWGFFNGVSNTSLIPTGDPAEINLFGIRANRNPNATLGANGLLSKIVYPSGGADSLEYEPNTSYYNKYIPAPLATVNRSVQGAGFSGSVSTSFNITVDRPSIANFDLSCEYSGSGTNSIIHQHTMLEISTVGDPLFYNAILKIDSSYSRAVTLQPGVYTVTLTSYGQAALGKLNFRYYPEGSFNLGNHQIGGVRLKRNLTIATNGATLKKKFVYAALDNQQQSSGIMRTHINNTWYYKTFKDMRTYFHYFNTFPTDYFCEYVMASSTPVTAISYYDGAHVFYRDVLEFREDDPETGGTAYQYLFSDSNNPKILFGDDVFGVPISNPRYPAGMEQRVRNFKFTGSTLGVFDYIVLKDIKVVYKRDNRITAEASNYVVRRNYRPSYSYSPPTETEFFAFDVQMYNHGSNWVYPDSLYTTTYDLNGLNPVLETKKYLYQNVSHYQPNEIIQTNSSGEIRKEVLRYPHEIVSATSSPIFQQLINENRIAKPVSSALYINDNLTTTDGIEYDFWNSNTIVQPSYAYTVHRDDERDISTVFRNYDDRGRLLVFSKSQGANIAYKYAYKNELPVFECKNASVDEIFFENFEENMNALLSENSHTGNRYFSGEYQINWNHPIGKSYVVAYFYLDLQGWNYKTVPYTNGMVLSDGMGVDDVAVYPVDAFAQSFTHDPVFGITSTIDNKGLTTYYEYDAYGRLLNIKDRNKFIVKNYSYNSTGKAYVVYYNSQKTQSFIKECGVGQGSQVVYTVAAGKYSSNESQEHVDAMALADVLANGQNYANVNGVCEVANISLGYVNDTRENPSTNLSTGGVQTIYFKDASNNTIYTFTEAQLKLGVSIAPGVYNLELITYGPYPFISNGRNGWAQLKIVANGAIDLMNVVNIGTNYTKNGVVFTGSSVVVNVLQIELIEIE